MDNLDRMYRHLVRTIRARFPQHLTQPFDVAELHQTILPYRLHRRELGLETNDDYEITLTELLAGARDYLVVDDRMRDSLRAELGSVNPDPSAFRKFAGSMVTLSPTALRGLEAGPDDDSTPLRPPVVTAESKPAAPRASASVAAPVPPAAAPPPPPPPPPPPRASKTAGTAPGAAAPMEIPRTLTSAAGARAIVPQADERCRSCDEKLPVGRPITFCPHCGQNVTSINCPACGSELELDWKFCPTCGRPARIV